MAFEIHDDMEWSKKRPEHWDTNDCLNFLRNVAIDAKRTDLRTILEPYQHVNGAALCGWRWLEFFNHDRVNGILFFNQLQRVKQSKSLWCTIQEFLTDMSFFFAVASFDVAAFGVASPPQEPIKSEPLDLCPGPQYDPFLSSVSSSQGATDIICCLYFLFIAQQTQF